MYDLTRLTLQNVTDIGITLRQLGQKADSLETVADRCTQYLYENLVDPATGKPACALSRFFITHPYSDLPVALQMQARRSTAQSADLSADLKCLTLLATAGDRLEWKNRHRSQGHQAIPLTSEQAVSKIPMISQMIKSFGLDISCVLAPDPHLLIALERQTCNVFYIPNALGSEFVPAQTDFVEPCGVKSVLGFGGMLPSGHLFAIILFAKVKIPQTTAQLFKTLPLNIKMAAIPFDRGRLFALTEVV